MTTSTLEKTDSLNSPLVQSDIDLWEQELDTPEAEASAEALVEVEKPTSRLARIREKLGFYSAMSTVVGFEAAGKVGTTINHFKENAAEKEDTSRRGKLKRWLGRGAAIAAGVIGTTIALTAHAKTGAIYQGGNGDTTGHGLINGLNGFGNPDYKVPINYPASIPPLPNNTISLDQSTQMGADATYNAIKAAGGDQVTAIGYSQGTIGTAEAASRIAAENGGKLPDNVDVVLIGGPQPYKSGAYDDPIFKAASPLLEGMGVDINDGEIPAGSVVYGKQGDFWSNSGGRNLIAKGDQLVGYLGGDAHHYTAAELNDTANQTSHVGPDGVTYITIHGSDTPALDVAEKNGFLVTEEARELSRAVTNLDNTEIGKAAPQADPSRIMQAGAAFIEDSARRAGVPIDIPSIPDFQVPAPLPAEHAPVVNNPIDQVQNFVDQFSVPAPAPIEAAPVPAPMPNPVEQQWTAPVQDFVEQWAAPAPAEVAPAYTPEVFEPVQQFVEQWTAPAPAAAPVAPALEQATTIVNDFAANNNLGNIQTQANDMFGQFLKH